MIILFAMINSLAAHENAPLAAVGPPNRAAWGVYVGDGKIRDRGGERRRGEWFNRITAKRPRRTSGGRRGLDLPSGHRQPETKRAPRRPLRNAGRRRCHDFDPSRAAGPNLAGSARPSLATSARMLVRVWKVASRPTGQLPVPACLYNPQAIV
jgi:hypothetical protein